MARARARARATAGAMARAAARATAEATARTTARAMARAMARATAGATARAMAGATAGATARAIGNRGQSKVNKIFTQRVDFFSLQQHNSLQNSIAAATPKPFLTNSLPKLSQTMPLLASEDAS